MPPAVQLWSKPNGLYHADVTRRPDFLFHNHAAVSALTRCVQSFGLVAVEAKRDLTDIRCINEAILHLQSDAARTMSPLVKQAPYCFGVLTDGSRWHLTRTLVPFVGEECKVITVATRAYLLHVKDDMVEFMQLLAGAVKVALARSQMYELGAPMDLVSNITIEEVLKDGNNAVARIKHSAVEGSVVFKYPTTLDKSRFAREVALWNQHKSWIGEIPNLVRLHARSAELCSDWGAAV